MSAPNNEELKSKIPEEFSKIIDDFTGDILITFPEYTETIGKWWNKKNSDGTAANNASNVESVFRHCIKVFPERFFDILYKNADIFASEATMNVDFLPYIDFKLLWKEDISDNTRETIWKYLQLILFSVIGSMNDTSEFGDTAKLFEAINEDELKTKLEETLKNMESLFSNGGDDEEINLNDLKDASLNMPMPNAEELHQHINSMMGGKLGKLAMELAEETANELNLEMEGVTDTKGVFQNLFKNPGKLMNMVKNIGSKLDEKMKSGEIKESEIISEGMELLNKMKSMPGMGNMEQMFSQMGIPGLGKGGKMNMGAMEAQLNRNLKTAKMKERMRNKANQKTTNSTTTSSTAPGTAQLSINEEEIIKVFTAGEKAERTPRGAQRPSTSANEEKKVSKKKKTKEAKAKV